MQIISNKMSFLDKFGLQDSNENIKSKFNNLLYILIENIMSDIVLECKFSNLTKQYQTLKDNELQVNKTYICKDKNNQSFKVIKILNFIYECALEEGAILFFAEKNMCLELGPNNIWQKVSKDTNTNIKKSYSAKNLKYKKNNNILQNILNKTIQNNKNNL